jgi:tetratricopeptide (TPR) repeat protein
MRATGPREGARVAELLRSGAAGIDAFDALWLAGEVSLGAWDAMRQQGGSLQETNRILAAGIGDYLEAATVAPAAAWPWTGLAGAYERVEIAEREARVTDLARLGGSPWLVVGRPGRIAIGLVRKAIAMEPRVFAHRDDLFLTLLRLGLRDEAKTAIREAARVQPIQDHHSTIPWSTLQEEYISAFVEGSIEALGATPLITRERHLLSLGQLERRLGRLDDAERHLREALLAPAGSPEHSEDAFHLALVLVDKRAYDVAGPALDQAERESVFVPSVLLLRARIAEARGRLDEALGFLQEARRRNPRSLDLSLLTSGVARKLKDWRAALESLRWAVLTHPEDPRPRVELVETLLDSGDTAAAISALADLERVSGKTPEAARLRARLDEAGRSSVRIR